MKSFKDFILGENWDKETKTPKKEKGKYAGKTVEELKAMLKELKASGPYKEDSEELETERELNFAIRAKTGWGKVTESNDETESEFKFKVEGKYLDFYDKFRALKAVKFLDTKNIRADETGINRGFLEFDSPERAKKVADIIRLNLNESLYNKGDIVNFLDDNGDTKEGTIIKNEVQKNSKGTDVKYYVVDCKDKIHNVPEGVVTKVVNEALSTTQKEQLKAMFMKSIDRFDDNMSVKDFATVIAEMFYEEWGQHNYSLFMTAWNKVKTIHLDDLDEK